MRYGVHSNSYQGDYKRVLCVCSAGILRSATAAHILCQEPYNFNTRNVGTAPYALIPLTDDVLQWADEIICMEAEHEIVVKMKLEELMYTTPVITLDIEDNYEYRNPELVKLIQMKYNQYVASKLPYDDNF
jgi:predicted protein tyrosine phosphatase